MSSYQTKIRKLFKFKKVQGYQVEVNRFGEVIDRTVLSKTYIDKDGYELLNIKTDKGKRTLKSVHQLVALTFIGSRPSTKYQVNHKDLDKSNNYYKNLEWCTCKYNVNHAIRNGVKWGNRFEDRRGEKNGRAKLSEDKIIDIRFLYSTGLYSKVAISRKYNVSPALIGKIIRRVIWKNI